MTDVIQLIQTTLDTAFTPPQVGTTPSPPSVKTFWLSRRDIDAETNGNEYIVYSVEERVPEAGADGGELIFRSYVTIRYFVQCGLIGDNASYATIKTRMNTARTALYNVGFDISSGWRDVGDVDAIGYETFVLSAEYTEAERGND